MSSEPTERKAGHPPAVKAGGMRVATKHKHDAQDTDAYDQKYVDSLPEPPNQHIVSSISSALAKTPIENPRDAKQEFQAAHTKPVPKVEKPHSPTKQNIRINQPRKMN